MRNRISVIGTGIFSLLLAIGCQSLVHAEGSRSLYPAGYEAAHTDEGRANLDLAGTTTVYLNVVPRRTFIYVYAQAGEYILLGSRNRTANNVGNINVYIPQSFGTKGYETIPGAASYTCSGGTTGLIDTRVKELAGPRSVDGTGNTSGYVPCAYQAPSSGIYGVLFSGGASGNTPNGVVDPPATSTNTVSAWDVTVRSSSMSSTTDINGRVFTYAWSSYSGGNGSGRRLYSDLYYVTDDGYRYRQSLKGIDPNAGTFFANAIGFRDQGQPLYKDIRGTDQPASTGLPVGVTADSAQYPIFFSDVSASGGADVNTTLGVLGIPLTPKPPQVNSFSFTYPPVSSSTSYVGQGGTFSFHVTDTLTFQIVISRDGVDWDPATATNRVITGTSGSGDYSVTWDGKDNGGNNFPIGNYQFRITGRNGEAHFPFVDIEGNLYGGPSLTKLNGNTIDSIVYYDDRGYVTRGGTSVGTLNGNICGQSGWPEPTPPYSLLGVDSADSNLSGSGKYYRWWPDSGNNANSDCAAVNQYFGDAKALNLWTYQTTFPQSNTFNIVDSVDVTATVSAPGSAAGGANVAVLVGFGNVGSKVAANTAYSIALPIGLSGVSCSGATCSYNSATGAVTITGLPSSLSPSQWQNVTLTYTAPASGNVNLSATVTTSSTQNPNQAPDTAAGTTVVGATPVADVMATVNAPATAAAGGVVSVSVTFANAGSLNASGVAYTLTLATGLSGVSCSGSGVTCSYDAGTGAVTLSGLPTALTAGQSVPFTISYAAPASGAVTVNAGVSTGSTETNTANNSASSSTTVVGGANADVAANLVAPATASPGSVVNVPVSFGNLGVPAAASVTYDMTLPAGLSGVSCSGATCSYNSGTGTISVSGLQTSLASGEWVSLTLHYTAPVSGVVSLSAHVATASTESDTGNNTASGSTTIATISSGADVAATVNPPLSATAGGTVNVPVTFTNLGPTSATGMTYNLTLPAGLSGVACSGATCSYDSGTGVVTVSGLPASLTNGESAGLTLSYTAPASGTLTVTANVTTTAADGNLGNNTASGTTTVSAGTTADVTTSVAPPATATATSTVSVPVTYSNLGPASAAGVTYTLNLTAGLSGVSCSGSGITCTYAGNVVSLSGMPASLANGASINFTLSYTAPASGTVTVSSQVATGTTESNSANNSASASTDISGVADMSVSLSGLPGTAQVGVAYSGTFTCSNVGGVDATAATTCSVSGLPAGVTQGSCAISPSSATWVAGDAVPAGQTVTCAVSGIPSAATTVTATGTTGATGDTNSANDSATKSITTSATPDMSINLSGLPATAQVGVPYSGTFTCSNIGGADASSGTSCAVTGLPGGWAVACAIGATPWSAGSAVLAGQTVTCTVTGTPSATGLITASGSTGATGDPVSANNTDTKGITVSAVGAPSAANDSATTNLDTPVTLLVTGNDAAASATALDLASVDLDPATPGRQTTLTVAGEGTFTAANDGTVTFTPVSGFTGTTTASYVVKDLLGAISNIANITVQVNDAPGNSTPLANPDSGTTQLNTTITLPALANDVASTSHTLVPGSIVLSGGNHGTWTANADGTVTFAPTSGFAGVATVNYTVTDSGSTTSNSATISITVASGAAPLAHDDSGSTAPATPVTLSVLNNDAATAGNTLSPATVAVVGIPAQGVWTANADGTVSFAPAAGFTGIATATYTVQDSGGATSNSATITIVVNPSAAPSAADDSASTAANTAVNLTPASNDTAATGATLDPSTIDLDPSTAGIQRGPVTVSGVGTWQVIDNAGTVKFTPAGGYSGTTPAFAYAISDSLGHTATANMSVSVSVATSTVSGTVFNDLNGNGLQDVGEVGAGGLNVVVVDGSNTVLAVTAVLASGSWTTSVVSGSGYSAYITTASPAPGSTVTPLALLPSGWVTTKENNNGTVDLTANGVLVGIDSSSAASLNFGIVAAADMSVAFSGLPATALPNANVSGTLTCTNNGPGDASYPICDLTTGGTLSNCLQGATSVTLPVSSLANGVSIICDIVATAPASGSLSLTGSTGAYNDNNAANDSASTSVTVNGVPDLTLTKTHSGNFTQGQTGATYSIVVTNSGSSVTTATVTVTENPPAGLTVTGMSGSGWTCGVSSCTRSDALAAGSSYPALTVTVNVSASAAASVSNNATVSGGGETDTGNDSVNDVTAINTALADVATGVTAPASGSAGSLVNVVIRFANIGAAAAANVSYAAQLPAGLSGIGCIGATCVYNSTTGVVTVSGLPGSLSAGQAANILLYYTAPASGTVNVSSTINTTSSESTTANNTASGSTLINGASEADVTTTVTPPATASAGAGVNVPVVFVNLGPVSANGMTYSAQLPGGLTGVSCSGSGASCVYDSGTGLVTISGLPASLANGQLASLVLTYTAPASGSVAISTTVGTSTSQGANHAPDTDSGSTAISAAATADVTTTIAPPATVAAGSTVNVPITYSNNGPVDAGSVTYTAQLPAGLTGVTCGGATCVYTSATGAAAISGLPGTLTNGQAVSLTLSYTAPASGTVNVSSTVATATTESNMANNTASSASTVDLVADLRTTVSAASSATTGSTVNVTIGFANNGPSTATGVTYSAQLPSGLTGVSCSGATCTYDGATGAVTISGLPGTLSNGQTASLVLSYTAPAAGPVVAHASIAATTTDSNPANNSDSGSTAISGPDLTLTKTHGGSFTQGQIGASYTLTVNNVGAGATAGTVTVVDTLPSGLTATAMTGSGWTCTLGTLTCTRSDSLAGGASYPVITLTVDVAANAAANVTNIATVSGGGETNTGNDGASDPTTVVTASVGVPDLVLAKTHAGSFTQGQTGAVYTLTVSNIGAAATSGTVTVTDTLPSGLTATAISGNGWTCTLATLTCSRSDALAAGVSYPAITLTVNVAANAAASVTNTAQVSGGGETVTGNDGATDPTVVIVVPSLFNGSISGSIWFDLNRNHQREGFETGRAGWRVELLTGGSAVGTTASNSSGVYTLVGTTTSNSSGVYTFTGLGAGTYAVRFINPAGGSLTSGPVPVNGENGVPVTGGGIPSLCQLSNVVLNAVGGGNVSGVNGQSLPIDPSGVVYDSVGRVALAGATVTLMLGGNPVNPAFVAGGSSSMVTAAGGHYSFFLLPAAPVGSYSLRVVSPGHTFPSAIIPATPTPPGFVGGPVTGIAGAPQGGQDTTYYLSFPKPTLDITNNNLPVDSAVWVSPVPALSDSMLLVLIATVLLLGMARMRRHGL